MNVPAARNEWTLIITSIEYRLMMSSRVILLLTLEARFVYVKRE